MNKFKITVYSIVLLIGVCCFGVGLGGICGYLYGYNNFTRWYGDVPMAFSTTLCVMFIGMALYLIGKTHLHNDKAK